MKIHNCKKNARRKLAGVLDKCPSCSDRKPMYRKFCKTCGKIWK